MDAGKQEGAAFELVFNPYETSNELTDNERLQLLRGVVFDSSQVSVSQRSRLCQRTPPLPPNQLRRADLSEWPDEALPSGLWKCHNLRELSCPGSVKITSVSPAICRMKHLRELNVAKCSGLRFLPFEITYTQLPRHRHLLAFTTGHKKDQLAPLPRFPTGPLSLKETIARAIVRGPQLTRRQRRRQGVSLPEDLESYLHSAKRCSKCQGPFFDTYFACWSAWDDISWKVPLLSISCSRQCARAIPHLMVADGEPMPPPPGYQDTCDYDDDGYGDDDEHDRFAECEEELLRDLI